jgi:hypothetical protein
LTLALVAMSACGRTPGRHQRRVFFQRCPIGREDWPCVPTWGGRSPRARVSRQRWGAASCARSPPGRRTGRRQVFLPTSRRGTIPWMAKRPATLQKSVKPTVTWQHAVFADVLSGLEALPQNACHISGRVVSCEGEGVETFIGWGKAEVESARRATSADLGRHTTQAVTHAKRALDSLFDQYLKRDWLDVRLKPRSQFSQKLALLRQRPGLWVPEQLIPRIIAAPRDKVEHQHIAPSLDDAVLAVEAAEAVSIAMGTKSDPSRGHVVYGFLTGGSVSGPWGDHQYFSGFSGPFALTWRGSDKVVRLAVGQSANVDRADCIYCDLSQMSLDEHFTLLGWWDARYTGSGRFQDEVSFRKFLRLAHLDQPSDLRRSGRQGGAA